jgi:hypothetical protein
MNFDLNIQNYKLNELIDMFDLPSSNYDRNIIEIKETNLRNYIIKNNEINVETKKKTLDFIGEAKNAIVNSINNIKQHQLDLTKKIYNLNDGTLEKTKLVINDDHMIQHKENTPFANSFPSEFYPGTINPLKKKSIRQYLNIDTRFRENYYGSPSTNYLLSLPLQFNDVLSLQLNAIEIPTNFYVISKLTGNNFFTIIVNDESRVVTIPDGNYNISGLLTLINETIYNFDNQFKGIIFKENISNGNGSGQIVVGINASYITGGTLPPITSISIDFQANILGNQDRNTPLPLKFGWLLGFRNGYYENSLVYISEGIPDLTGPKYIYLVVDDFNNNVNNGFYSAFNSSILNNNILARISLQANTFSSLIQNNLNIVTTPRQYFGPVNINNLNIQLLDEYGRILDLNNSDYSFCLTLQTSYDI